MVKSLLLFFKLTSFWQPVGHALVPQDVAI